MTRAELIEQYFLDPLTNGGLLPSKIRFAAEFADLSVDDQNAVLKSWTATRKADLDVSAAELRTKADEAEALGVSLEAQGADIEISKP
jgi:hypothetical protein